MDLKDLQNIKVFSPGAENDDHDDKKIIEFLEKLLQSHLTLRDEVDRLAKNQEKILDYLEHKENEAG